MDEDNVVSLRRPDDRAEDPLTEVRPGQLPAEPLVSYQTYRQLSGWILPPLVNRAIGAH